MAAPTFPARSKDLLRRWVWLVPSLAVFFASAFTRGGDHVDAGVFGYAYHALTSARGLHLYADHPEVQVGPLGILLAHIGSFDHARLSVPSVAVSVLLFLLVLLGLRRAVGDRSEVEPGLWVMSITGSCVGYAWSGLVPATAHVEDALAIALMVWAFVFSRRERMDVAGVLIALAVAAKPWGIFAAGLVLVPKGRLRGLAGIIAVSAVCWLPFLVTEPHSLTELSKYRIDTGAGSLWSLWGLDYAPHYERPLQLAVAVAGAIALWRVGMMDCVLLWIFGSRLFLDAGTFGYYLPGLVVGAALIDMAAMRSDMRARIPIVAPAALAFTSLGPVPLADQTSWSRVAVIAAVVGIGCFVCWHASSPDGVTERPRVPGVRRIGRVREIAPFGLNPAGAEVDS